MSNASSQTQFSNGEPMSQKIKFIPGEIVPCNESGPDKYHCTVEVAIRGGEKVSHVGQHVASAVVGDELGSEIVRWGDRQPSAWNMDYRGR